jgi:hypothetical protein
MYLPLVKAFEAWESEFREHPDRFLTKEDLSALDVQPLSAQRAEFLIAILDRLSQGQAWITLNVQL